MLQIPVITVIWGVGRATCSAGALWADLYNCHYSEHPNYMYTYLYTIHLSTHVYIASHTVSPGKAIAELEVN